MSTEILHLGDAAKCDRCGGDIPADAPGGVCPRCALAGALPTAQNEPTPEEVAAKLPGFEILGILGRGGMGVVFKARQKALDRVVALKVLPPATAKTAGFAERFAREAKAMARLAHPNIVAVHEFGESGGLFYLVLEYVDGANIREAMAAGRVGPSDALTIVPQICDALQYAHDRGVVHRDIKPENVLIARDGRVKIADFGLAKLADRDAADRSLTGAGQVMGTLRYMAPEQWERPKDVDHRADIYSLGVVFYEMLTGELPMGRFEPPSKRAAIDVRIDEVVMRSIERDRERRWQRADEMKTHVSALSTPAAPPLPPHGPPPDAARAAALPEARPPWYATAAAVVASSLGGLAFLIAALVTDEPRGLIVAYWWATAVCFIAGAALAASQYPRWRRMWDAAEDRKRKSEAEETAEQKVENAGGGAVFFFAVAVVAAIAALVCGEATLESGLWWTAASSFVVGVVCVWEWASAKRRLEAAERAANSGPVASAAAPVRPEPWLSTGVRALAATGAMVLVGTLVWSVETSRSGGQALGSLAIGMGLLLLVLLAIRWNGTRARPATSPPPGPPVLLVVTSIAAIALGLFCVVHALVPRAGTTHAESPSSSRTGPTLAPWEFATEASPESDEEKVTGEDRQSIARMWARAQALQGDGSWSEDRTLLYHPADQTMVAGMDAEERRKAAAGRSLGIPMLVRSALNAPLSNFRIENARFGGWNALSGGFASALVTATDGRQTLRFQMRRNQGDWMFVAAPVEVE